MTAPPAPAYHLHATLARVASPDQLAAAWADVLASDHDDGIPAPGVARVMSFDEGFCLLVMLPEHGHREESVHGVLLTKAGREILLAGYERRMLQHTKGALPGLSGLSASLRRHLYRQAERLAAYIHDPTATWTGLSWR